MGRAIAITTVILLMQLGLVGVMTMQDRAYEPYSPSDLLAAFVPAEIDTILLNQRGEGKLVLKRAEVKWFLVPAAGQRVPADSALVEDLLIRIAGLKKGLAIATSKDAAARFEVGLENFGYHLQLFSGEEQQTELFFGTSAGLKKLHARVPGSNEIIIVPLGSHELTTRVGQWIDKNVLKIKKEEVAGITFDKFSLVRQDDGGWQVSDDAENTFVSPDEASRLAEKLCDLSVHDFLAEDEQNEAENNPVHLGFTMTTTDERSLDWRMRKDGENDYVISRSDLDYFYKVSAWQIEEIEKILAGKQGEEYGSATDFLDSKVSGSKQ